MATQQVIIGRTLAALGIVLNIAGAGYCIAFLFGLLLPLPAAGVVAMVAGNTLGWFGNSLAAGTLKSDVTETLKSEARDTLRLRTQLGPIAAALVVLGFITVVVAGVLVWWWITQGAT